MSTDKTPLDNGALPLTDNPDALESTNDYAIIKVRH